MSQRAIERPAAMNMPSDYRASYEKARIIDPDMASNYIAHTLIGDPDADALMEELSHLRPEEPGRFIHAAMNDVNNPVL